MANGDEDQVDYWLKISFKKKTEEIRRQCEETTECGLESVQEVHTHQEPHLGEPCYDMSKPGKLLWICNYKGFNVKDKKFEDRDGYQSDIDAIRQTFGDRMKFEIVEHWNLTGMQMKKAVMDVCDPGETFRDKSCFILAVSTHGEKGGVLYATDEAILLSALVEPIQHCSSLVGKPKLIFIQACRGSNVNESLLVCGDHGTRAGDKSFLQLPETADFLFAFSTVEGYLSFNRSSGSWFYQMLCAEFQKYWKSSEVLQIMTRVARAMVIRYRSSLDKEHPHYDRLHNKQQVSCVTTTLTKALYFGQLTRA
jgi:hypothetical protein